YANVVILGTRRGTQTDDGGHFRITAVPPGRWQLLVDAIGLPKVSEWIDVVAGDTLHRTIRIARSQEDRGVLIRDSLRTIGRWPPYLDPRLEARMREARDVRILRLDPTRYRDPPPPDTTHFLGGWPIVAEVRRPRAAIDSLLPVFRDTALYVDLALGA